MAPAFVDQTGALLGRIIAEPDVPIVLVVDERTASGDLLGQCARLVEARVQIDRSDHGFQQRGPTEIVDVVDGRSAGGA